ncbi:MAG: hypothetical protein UW11_C0027G0006 [Parcubacteria group bacterium GW2011_GWA2_43_9b]|nr:MAG: hypothetical protein UW11_C0027G0006 [Parcubacteria group bacterium GW2011_GWA2_43_9b]
MAERPDPKDYVYCEKHDIFFNAEPEERGCPLCMQEIFATAKDDPQKTLFQGSEDLSKI